MKIGIGKAHGKIILIGEHAVVYGTRAIAIPFFNTKVLTKVWENEENYIRSEIYTGSLKDARNDIESIQSLINELQLKLELPNLFYDIDSNIPVSSGMGSSAAVASSIVEAVYNFKDIELSDKTRFEWTQFSERIAHGNPSGIDAQTTTHNHAIIFQKNYGMLKFNVQLDAYLIVGESGEKGNTKEAVSAVRRLIEEENKQGLINDIGIQVEECYESIISRDIVAVGNTLTKAQKKLKELEVSTKRLDKMVELALENRALGAKLTGGGRGGCVIALSEDIMTAEIIKNKWMKLTNKPAWILYLGEELI